MPSNDRPQRRRRIGPVALTIFLAAVGAAAYLGLQRTAAWQGIETQAQDWRFRLRGPRPPPDNVIIAAIDDHTLAEVGSWPLSRHVLADVVGRLENAGAAVIGFDLLLLERGGDVGNDGNAELAAALAHADNVVLAVAYRVDTKAPARQPTLQAAAAGDLLTPPTSLVANVDLGHVNVVVDDDGRLRRLLPAIGRGDLRFSALPIQMAKLYQRRRDGDAAAGASTSAPTEPATANDSGRWLDFYGPERTVPTISLADVLAGRAGDVVNDRAVLVGATAAGIGDAFATPFSVRMPGVEYFATALGNLLEGRFIRRDEAMVAIDAAAVAVGVVFALALVRLLSPVVAIALALMLSASWLALTQGLFVHQGLWLSALGPPLAIALTTLCALAGRVLAERQAHRDSTARERNLRRYVAPALADDLAAQERPHFTGRDQTAAVLFTDIAGFTRISEAIGPKRSATLLQAFHQKVETAVNRNGGVLTTFLGDGAMAVFGLPEPKANDPVRAISAALDLVRDIDAWAPLRIGVGVHYGPVTIAQLGGRAQRQITATGDTVNLASRLESQTRPHDALIAVSAGVIEAMRAQGRADLVSGFRHAAREQVKGRREPVDVWVLPAKEKTADATRGVA